MPSTKPVLKIRLAPEEKAAIEAAAREAGLSASQFVLQCSLRKGARFTERADLLLLNLIERAITAVEQIVADQGEDTSPVTVASNLVKADRLIADIDKLRAMFGGHRP